jgi:hypothetical protein
VKRLCVATVVLAALVAPSVALGQSADADALFHEARKLVDAGDFAHACPKFAESERLDPAPGTLLNLAQCEEHIGHVVEAQEHYRLAASGFKQKDPRRDVCTTKASELDAHIAHVTLRLAPSSPEGTVVKRDATVLGAADLGQSVAMNPGTVAVVVSAPGHEDKSYPLTIKDGDSTDMTLEVGPAVRENPAIVVVEKPKATSASSPVRPVGIAVAAVGIVGIGIGIVTGVMALDRANTVKAHCNTTTDICADQIGYSAAQDGQTLSTLSTATFIAGGVLAALGTVLFIVGGHSSAKARMALTLGGVRLEGTF